VRLIVVGSGVVGASCAYAAVSLGADVVLVGPYAGAVAARAAMGLPADVDLAPLDPLRPPARPA
jgi:glycine/D-amino acid oxidase-like deaminating enzyme